MVDDSGTDEEIPLPNVKTAILSKVIDYCKYHKDPHLNMMRIGSAGLSGAPSSFL